MKIFARHSTEYYLKSKLVVAILKNFKYYANKNVREILFAIEREKMSKKIDPKKRHCPRNGPRDGFVRGHATKYIFSVSPVDRVDVLNRLAFLSVHFRTHNRFWNTIKTTNKQTIRSGRSTRCESVSHKYVRHFVTTTSRRIVIYDRREITIIIITTDYV